MLTDPLNPIHMQSTQNKINENQKDKTHDLSLCQQVACKSQLIGQIHLYSTPGNYADRLENSPLVKENEAMVSKGVNLYADTAPTYHNTSSEAVHAAAGPLYSDKENQPFLANQPHMVLTSSQVKHVLGKEKKMGFSSLKRHRHLSADLKKVLGEATYKQVMAYMKEKGEALVKQAAVAQKTLVLEVAPHHHLIFKPSGKVYISAQKVGEGKFKVTSKVALLMATKMEKLKEVLHVRAFSLTKQISDSKQQQLSKEEKEINLYLKAQVKHHDLSHVNVAKSVSAVNLDQVGVMSELCDTDVDHLLASGGLTEAEKLNIAGQMSRGVAQLHSVGVVHRDIKPDNFLVQIDENGKRLIKITDFGLSSQVDPSKRTTNSSVSLRYADPAWRGTNPESAIRFSTPSDVYQLGMEICQVYAGCTVEQWVALQAKEMSEFQTPGNVKDQFQLLREWKTHPDQWSALKTILDESVRAMVRRMVDSNPDQRPSAEEVAVFLEQKQQPVA